MDVVSLNGGGDMKDMTQGWHTGLKKSAGDFRRVDKMLRAVENRRGAFERMGWPEALQAITEDYTDELNRWRNRLLDNLGDLMVGTPYEEWADEVHMLGLNSLGLITGCLPPPWEMHSHGAVNKYVGLHVEGGTAVKSEQGKFLGFSKEYRAFALYRLGKPVCEMAPKGSNPYRQVYDDRKEHTLISHPPMLDEGDGCDFCDDAYEWTRKHRSQHRYSRERQSVGRDCSNMGGRHWTKGHRRADALRVATKEVLRDWWRVGNGKDPLFGGHSSHVDHRIVATGGGD